jgi:acyl-CoA synthetase (NDP forming)
MGLPFVRSSVVQKSREAVEEAKQIGYPVAMKVASRRIIHKTEAGGVVLNLADDAAVRKAFDKIRKRVEQKNESDAMDGVIVQSMIPEGTELMMGVTEDPLFGPLIAFGLGGIHVEILKDVCFRVTPLTDVDALEMIHEIKGFPLLEGYRGHTAADIPAIQKTLLKVSRLVEEVPEISELDLNPIFALPPGKGCLIADARIYVRG